MWQGGGVAGREGDRELLGTLRGWFTDAPPGPLGPGPVRCPERALCVCADVILKLVTYGPPRQGLFTQASAFTSPDAGRTQTVT